MEEKGLRKAIRIGAIVGAMTTLITAFFMDLVFSDVMQGTWWDAAAKDVNKMFGPDCGQNWFAIALTLTTVMAFLAGFGAILGAAAGGIMNRFFKLLFK